MLDYGLLSPIEDYCNGIPVMLIVVPWDKNTSSSQEKSNYFSPLHKQFFSSVQFYDYSWYGSVWHIINIQRLFPRCIQHLYTEGHHRGSEHRQWRSSLALGALLTACASVAEITSTTDWRESWESTSFFSLVPLICLPLLTFLSSGGGKSCTGEWALWGIWRADCSSGHWDVMVLVLLFRLDFEPC